MEGFNKHYRRQLSIIVALAVALSSLTVRVIHAQSVSNEESVISVSDTADEVPIQKITLDIVFEESVYQELKYEFEYSVIIEFIVPLRKTSLVCEGKAIPIALKVLSEGRTTLETAEQLLKDSPTNRSGEEERVVEELAEVPQSTEKLEVKPIEVKVKDVKVENQELPYISSGTNYRLTTYTPRDGNCTGTGLCTSDFQVNDRGWFTYQGKLVLAGASAPCLREQKGACSKWNTANPGILYFDYYDEVVITIDGIEYQGIILDSCGASMSLQGSDGGNPRIDLFASSLDHRIDRGYKGKNPVQVRISQ